jgi:glycosyltransferase involved in cell wall biosynthesis
LNVDGLERKRRKWNALGRLWYVASERLATWIPHAIVTDARVIESYYLRRYGCRSVFIPYGCEVGRSAETSVLERFGLVPGEYVLYVSRLEPENNAHAVVAGFEATTLAQRLAVVGSAPYARDYIARVRQLASDRVVFTGAVFGEGYRQLQSHAFAYVHATEVGGTHPALVEAMGCGNCVVVNDVPENREVAGDAALYFDARKPQTLAAALETLAANPRLVEDLRGRATARARLTYSWDAVTDAYEALFNQMRQRRGSLAA